MHKAVRGAIAAIPITLVMIHLFRRLPAEQGYPLPPRLIIKNLQKKGKILPGKAEASATHTTLLAYVAYGAAVPSFLI